MSTLTIRVSEQRKIAIKMEADKAGETLTDFVLKAILFRVTHGKVSELAEPQDPFLAAISNLPPVPLSREQKADIARIRKGLETGTLKTSSLETAVAGQDEQIAQLASKITVPRASK